MNTHKERRRYERYKVKSHTAVVTYPTIIVSLNVIDVSEAGMAFSYAGWEEWPNERIKIDILDREFFLENISAHIVSDVQLDEESKSLRRCSVEFSNIEKEQKDILNRYIVSVASI